MSKLTAFFSARPSDTIVPEDIPGFYKKDVQFKASGKLVGKYGWFGISQISLRWSPTVIKTETQTQGYS